jgi:cytochrome c peroxidase
MDDVTAGRNLFVTNNCAGCHGGSLWTVARRFFIPNEMNNAAAGRLRMTNYVAPAAPFPLALNPPANNMTRTAPLRFTPPAEITDPAMRAALIGANDQINCVLRAVGTFPTTLDAMQNGITPTGVRVREVRANMATPAQGATGFSPPALVGMGTAAPFFHAGNARTLEELFSATFGAHYRALSPNFLQAGDRATQVRQIVAFLLTIDDDTTVISPPTTLGYNPDLCPTSL